MSSSAHAATQSDVARAAGVSRSLVSLALSGSPRVAPHTRERVQQAAAELGYRVNVAASSLARRHSTIVGLVLPNLRNAFFERMARALGQAAADRGLTLLLAVGGEEHEVLHRSIDSLLGVRVAGIIMISPWLADEELLAIGQQTPTCVVGRTSPGGAVDCVHIDEAAAAGLIVEHLHSRGVQAIAYIRPRRTDSASWQCRRQALEQASARAGLPMSVYECGEDAGPAVRTALGDHSAALGLVMHNDALAIDAVPVLRETARPGQAQALLASYDNTYLAQREEFSLTSIHQPEDLMAHHAVALICQRAGIRGGLGAKEPQQAPPAGHSTGHGPPDRPAAAAVGAPGSTDATEAMTWQDIEEAPHDVVIAPSLMARASSQDQPRT